MNAYLAYALKDGNCVFEIPDMKDRNDKLDIGVVTDTVDRIEPTGLTEGILLRRTLEDTIHIDGTNRGKHKLTKRRSSTPSLTGALSVVVYRSLCVT